MPPNTWLLLYCIFAWLAFRDVVIFMPPDTWLFTICCIYNCSSVQISMQSVCYLHTLTIQLTKDLILTRWKMHCLIHNMTQSKTFTPKYHNELLELPMLCYWARQPDNQPPALKILYVLHRWCWVPQSHIWQPLTAWGCLLSGCCSSRSDQSTGSSSQVPWVPFTTSASLFTFICLKSLYFQREA